mmetsp:Transcript_4080/g.11595  ORF Transcript_4080/g.11595 Transcript_4080/m.11595 type:complete len:208 (-) Transcript_4080:250-873(-)
MMKTSLSGRSTSSSKVCPTTATGPSGSWDSGIGSDLVICSRTHRSRAGTLASPVYLARSLPSSTHRMSSRPLSLKANSMVSMCFDATTSSTLYIGDDLRIWEKTARFTSRRTSSSESKACTGSRSRARTNSTMSFAFLSALWYCVGWPFRNHISWGKGPFGTYFFRRPASAEVSTCAIGTRDPCSRDSRTAACSSALDSGHVASPGS